MKIALLVVMALAAGVIVGILVCRWSNRNGA